MKRIWHMSVIMIMIMNPAEVLHSNNRRPILQELQTECFGANGACES